MSNDKRDNPASIEWMTLPSLGPEADPDLDNSFHQRGETHSNGDISDTILAADSLQDSQDQFQPTKPTGTEAAHPPPRLSRWLNTFRKLSPAPKTLSVAPSRRLVVSNKGQPRQTLNATLTNDLKGQHTGQDLNNDNTLERIGNDNDNEERDQEEEPMDMTIRVKDMTIHLRELHAQLHQAHHLGTNAGAKQHQYSGTAAERQQNCGEDEVVEENDKALFEELLKCYFGRQLSLRADKQWRRQQDSDNDTVSQDFHQQAFPPHLSAAKTEMVYQVLTDLGGMLVGHEPPDRVHLDHLRKTIPEMIRAARTVAP